MPLEHSVTECTKLAVCEYLWRKYADKKAILEHLCDHSRIIPY